MELNKSSSGDDDGSAAQNAFSLAISEKSVTPSKEKEENEGPSDFHSPPVLQPKQIELQNDVWSKIAELEKHSPDHQKLKLAALIRIHNELQRREKLLRFAHVSLLKERNLYLKKLHTIEHVVRNKGNTFYENKENDCDLGQILEIKDILFGPQSANLRDFKWS
mmetsp:Transcript_28448/g.37181  ORF Transcript_28448/g.37181 Transcript_28448/m.37181 type:complete len:164 (+) Transcript_28448:67-558(+)